MDNDYTGQRECASVNVFLLESREEKKRVINVHRMVGGEGTLPVMEEWLAEVQLWVESGGSWCDTVSYWFPAMSLTDAAANWSGQVFMHHQLESI